MQGTIIQTLNRRDATPLYMQLKTIVREKISSGEWAPGCMIPSENELAKTYGVSRMTARSVITQFVADGFLYRIQGKGTFVSEQELEISSLTYAGIREQLEKQGKSVVTKLISCQLTPADRNVAKRLNIKPGEKVYRIKRVREVGGINISYHESFVPAALCPNLDQKDLEGEQLCAILRTDYLLPRGKIIEHLGSRIAGRSEAKYLNVAPGFPLILLQDQIYIQGSNTICEYTDVYFRGDKVKIRLEYNTPAG